MRGPRLYQHLRESGLKVTMKEAEVLRDAWFKCYPEMEKFMDREPIKQAVKSKYFPLPKINYEEDDDNNEVAASSRELYVSTTITGFVRNRCTYNASLNTRFQNPVANLAKRALWKLEQLVLPNGDRFGDRMLNFVHDEVDFWVYPNEAWTLVPMVKDIWLSPGKEVFPKVKLSAEASMALRWDKHAAEWPDIKWTDDHMPILEEPEEVKQILLTD